MLAHLAAWSGGRRLRAQRSVLRRPFYVDGDHRCLGFIALTLIERRRQILLNSSFPFSNDHAFKDFEI